MSQPFKKVMFVTLPCCSGFDRGHMAPAGNHRKDQVMCDQTFLLSNMAPQVISMAVNKVIKVMFRWGGGSTGTNGNTWSGMQGSSPNSTGSRPLLETRFTTRSCATVQECVRLHWASLLATHGGGWKDVCQIPGRSVFPDYILDPGFHLIRR